jgi:SAM-dependent methyltransferase
MMQEQDLIEQWKQEEKQPFNGWDFSYLKGRFFGASPPWSYEEKVRTLLRNADSVLDIGAGGGEKLLEFKDLLPPNTLATEGWPPNILLAREHLKPYGIKLIPYGIEKDHRMPFQDNTFSLVINRHTAYDAVEVARILKSGGKYLTQQVDGQSMADLSSVFGRGAPHPHVTLAICRKELEEAGLIIEFAEESMGKMRFTDVGAFVYFAHAAPWEVPADFSVERYANVLLELHNRDMLTFDMGHFIMQAYKPS